jgi:transcriptional regulator with XRE-family HTH domain
MTYEQLAGRTGMSRGSLGNYLFKRGHRRDTATLMRLLDVLGACEGEDRTEALRLHQRAGRPARRRAR